MFTREEKSEVWSLWRLFLGIGAATVISVGAFSFLMTPAKVIQKTLDTDNIITSYEWFHDVNAAYKSRIGQIKSQQSTINSIFPELKTGSQKAPYLQDLEAMRQSCRDLVTRYNANSIKTNKSIFKGREAPESLDINSCEVKI